MINNFSNTQFELTPEVRVSASTWQDTTESGTPLFFASVAIKRHNGNRWVVDHDSVLESVFSDDEPTRDFWVSGMATELAHDESGKWLLLYRDDRVRVISQ